MLNDYLNSFSVRPIVVTLFSEMTVLGFLSLVTYAMDYSGLCAAISVAAFGTEGEDYLLETLETIHYLLFLVLVLTILQVVMMTGIADVAMQNFTVLNLISQNPEDIRPYLEKLDDTPNLTFARWFWDYFCMGPIDAWKYHADMIKTDATLVFYSVRKEFLGCRSALPNYLLAAKSKRLPANFDFARYLSLSLSNYFVKLISFTPETWLMLWAFALLVYVIAVAVNGDMLVMAIIWLILGYFDLLVIYALSLKCTHIVEHLLNPGHFHLIDQSESSRYAERTPSPSMIDGEAGPSRIGSRRQSARSVRSSSHDHEKAKGKTSTHEDLVSKLNLEAIERDVEGGAFSSRSHDGGSMPNSARDPTESTNLLHRPGTMPLSSRSSVEYVDISAEGAEHSSIAVRTRQHALRKPLWTAIRPSEQSWLSTFMLGKHVPNKHEMLFWADKFGPTLNMFILRIHLFVQSIYFSLLVCYYIPAMFIEHQYYWGIAYLVVSIIPFPILIFGIYPQLLINMILAASTGILKEKPIVVEIIRQQKLEKVMRLLVMLTKLQGSARMAGKGAPAGPGQAVKPRKYDPEDPKIKAEIAEIGRIYDMYDTDGGTAGLLVVVFRCTEVRICRGRC
jgi:hypothetical protein